VYSSSKKLASRVVRNIPKGLCVTGLMLVPVVCAIRIVKVCSLPVRHRQHVVDSIVGNVVLRQLVDYQREMLQKISGMSVYARTYLESRESRWREQHVVNSGTNY
jgi:hypothetical protein